MSPSSAVLGATRAVIPHPGTFRRHRSDVNAKACQPGHGGHPSRAFREARVPRRAGDLKLVAVAGGVVGAAAAPMPVRAAGAHVAAADAQALMDTAGGVLGGGEARRLRFETAQKHVNDETQGSYGEFPLTGLLAILQHPAVNDVLVAAEHGWGTNSEGSVDDSEKISRAAAFHPVDDCEGDECDVEATHNAFQPSFVDIGSGAGRLILAASTMRAWRSVTGIEASEPLATLGSDAIAALEDKHVVQKGLLKSIHADANLGSGSVECLFDASCVGDPTGVGDGGQIAHAASALAGADIALAYSTAFPSPDGLRLPELSAALSAVMRPGAVCITCDKWLVGRRFQFVDMLIVQGEEGPEDQIRCFIWRVVGDVPVAAADRDKEGRAGVALVAQELEKINKHWMDEEDACSQNPEACSLLLESLESELAVVAGVADMDLSAGGDSPDIEVVK